MIEKIVINEGDMTKLKQRKVPSGVFFYEYEPRLFNRSAKVLGWNIQYEEKLDMLAVIIAVLKENKEEEEYDTWKETFRFYVDRKKNTYIPEYKTKGKDECKIYTRTGNIFVKRDFNTKTNRWSIDNMPCTNMDLSILRHRDCFFEDFSPMECLAFGFPFSPAKGFSREEAIYGDSIKEVKKFFGSYYITEDKLICKIEDFASFLHFLSVKETKKTESDIQKRIDKFSNLKKLRIGDFCDNPLFARYERRNKMAIMERLPDDSGCVLRMFCIFGKANKKAKSTTIEIGRIYIFKDTCVYATKNNLSEWVEDDINQIERQNLAYKLVEFDKDIVKGTVLFYTYELLNDVDPKFKPIAAVSLITKPIFEQLCKIGYKNLVMHLFMIECDYSMPIYDLEFMCGITDPTKSELYAKLGVNKFQFDAIFKKIKHKEKDDLRESYFAFPLRMLRFIVNGVKYEEVKIGNYVGRHHFASYLSIANMDEKTFLKLLSFAEYLHKYNKDHSIGDHLDCIAILNTKYGLKAVLNMQDHLMQMSISQLRLYRDYLCTVEKLDMFDKYKYNVTDMDELAKLHDEAVELYNQAKDVMNREKFLQRVDTWKQWEYEDKKYVAIAPNAPEEIADEGKNLHHCVGTYIDRVAQGRTNIMFIRKKSDLSKSYFTAEVSNEGAIVQVHGFSNKLLSKEPNLIPFVKSWAKEKGLDAKDVL